MKGGYQILDLKNVDLSTLNGTTSVINLTDEEVKALQSGKVILLNNVRYRNVDFNSVFATNSKSTEFIDLLCEYSDEPIVIQLSYDSINKKISNAYVNYLNKYILPSLPTTTANKTYVLKLVDGTLTWVEEVAESTQTEPTD